MGYPVPHFAVDEPWARQTSSIAKYLEVRRHTDNDDDALSEEGVRHALAIGGRFQVTRLS